MAWKHLKQKQKQLTKSPNQSQNVMKQHGTQGDLLEKFFDFGTLCNNFNMLADL